jgi:ATP-dependent helicase/nuclease subunit B
MDPSSERMEFLARGEGLAIAANSRASRALRRAYATWQVAHGAKAWNSAPISDWNTWMASLWGDYLFTASNPPLLLSRLQEHWLWRRVLKVQPEAKHILSIDALAALAQQAYALLSDYEVALPHSRSWSPQGDESPNDAEAFRRWTAAFEAECTRKRVVSPGKVESVLTDAIQSGLLKPPAHLQLIGFDRFTPAQSSLLNAMKTAGSQVEALEPHSDSTARRLVLAPSRREEISACAAWLRKTLLDHPEQRIAVIVPDVAAVRGEIDRTFRRTLAPESMDVKAAPVALPFEFSLGVPLSTVPVAHAALMLLRWLKDSLTAEEISWLLLSGFVALTDTEALELANVDSRIRNSGLMPMQISLPGFLMQFRKYKRDSRSRLADRLAAMQRQAQGKPLRSPLEWAELAQGLLQSAGWPGPAELDSIEFQARQKWTETLEGMATLGFDGSEIDYNDFLAALARHTEEVIFAPESSDAQIQILGPAESSGQTFDAIWFMGVDEGSWPIFGTPHPMIPLSLQRSAGMPHSTPQADNEFARILTKRISKSAPVLIVSHAQQNNDGALRASPLVRELEGLRSAQTSHSFFEELGLEKEAYAFDRTEKTFDSDPIPWPENVSAGGVSILKRQSACAFQSFAQKRLATGELTDAGWGLSPLQRGDLLHLVLEKLWTNQPGSSSQLHSLDDLQAAIRDHRLGEIVSEHIEEVFTHHKATQSVDAWSRAYLESEKRRLHSLLTAWLIVESKRVPFEIDALEMKIPDISVGGLSLNLRVDRIDRLPGGERLLIDYKSGEVRSSMWNPPRMDEPQLPVYAIHGGLEEVVGIVFAQIRAGDQEFIGRLEDAKAHLFASLNQNSQLMKHPLTAMVKAAWSDDLLNLADAFLRGEASVAPKHYPGSCQYCNLASLCRVKETGTALVEIDSADDEGSPQAGATA